MQVTRAESATDSGTSEGNPAMMPSYPNSTATGPLTHETLSHINWRPSSFNTSKFCRTYGWT